MLERQPRKYLMLVVILWTGLLSLGCTTVKIYDQLPQPEESPAFLVFTGPIVLERIDGKRMGLFNLSEYPGRDEVVELGPGDHTITIWFNTAGSTRKTSRSTIDFSAESGRTYRIRYKIIGPSISSIYGGRPKADPWQAWIEDVTAEPSGAENPLERS